VIVDAANGQHREYIELAEPLLAERAVLVIDNLLVGGEVALPEGAEGRHSAESVASARALNPELLGSENWLRSVLAIGDGVGFRRPTVIRPTRAGWAPESTRSAALRSSRRHQNPRSTAAERVPHRRPPLAR
jgi:hypothetical protein